MNIIRATPEQISIINHSRERQAGHMALAGSAEAPLMVLDGACATDSNRLSNGLLGSVAHNEAMYGHSLTLKDVAYAGRYTGEKPRTHTGYTGLIHQHGGAHAYTEGASYLTNLGVPLAAELMEDVGSLVAGQFLTVGWTGARNDEDTGPRYLGRPTSLDREQGIHPLAMWVKPSRDGSLDAAVHALTTIRSETPESRLRLTPAGVQTVETYGNPHTGLILRGSAERPAGSLEDIVAAEVLNARNRMDTKFGRIPIIIDLSHDHTKWAGGGEAGQLAMAQVVARLIRAGLPIDGYMAETYLLGGKQDPEGRIPGLSLTDVCLGEGHAKTVMRELSEAWAARPVAQLALANSQ